MKVPGAAGRVECPFADTESAEIRLELGQLLATPPFMSSPRRAQLLRYLVERTLEGRSAEINEYGVGLDVFGKPPSFDPRLDSTVRAEVSRLRHKLKEHYSAEGRDTGVAIDLPARSYVPEFTFRIAQAEPSLAPARPLGRWFSWGVLAMVVLAGGGLFEVWRWRSAVKRPVESLVVLPFTNMSADAQNEYIADGLTEELTNELAQSPDLRVVARTSAFAFKGKGVDVRDVGKKLNVEAVLEGSVDKQGDRIRVTAQMNRSSNGYHLWSKSYEAQSKDMMVLQDEMARSIAQAVRGVGRPAPLPPRSTNNADAHDLYLRGIYQFSLHTPESYGKARDLCQSAAEEDPSYVSAYLCIATVENGLIHLTAEQPEEGYRRMRAAVSKALELNPGSGQAHAIAGTIAYTEDWDWPRAERECKAALEHTDFHSWYGWALATRGRFREAQEQFRVSDDLDPLNLALRFNQMIAFLLERRYDQATQVLNQELEASPNQLDAHAYRGLIAVYRHDCAAADPDFQFCARNTQIPAVKFFLAAGSACRGDQKQAREYLSQMETAASFASPYQLASGYALLHDKERALSYLQKSAEAHEPQILYIKYDPAFDEVRSDAAFLALEKKIGLI